MSGKLMLLTDEEGIAALHEVVVKAHKANLIDDDFAASADAFLASATPVPDHA